MFIITRDTQEIMECVTNIQHTREKGNKIHSEKKSISYAHWH